MDTTQYLQRDGSNPGNDWVLMVRSGVVNSNAAGGRLVENCVAQQPHLRVLMSSKESGRVCMQAYSEVFGRDNVAAHNYDVELIKREENVTLATTVHTSNMNNHSYQTAASKRHLTHT
jgi:hypothetical protein